MHDLEPRVSPLKSALGTVLGGGASLVCASLVWSLLIPRNGDLFMRLGFGWLFSAWVVFPVGAGLAWLLPRFVARRSLLASFGIGLLAGVAAGLVLTAGVWLWSNHRELIGLVTNRNSGGYASYSYSVRKQLGEGAWRMLSVIPPVATAWVTGWALLIHCSKRLQPVLFENPDSVPAVSLRLSPFAFKIFGTAVVGFGILATAALLVTSWISRGVDVPLTSYLVVGPGAAGLVILGPWLGPMVNPGGDSTFAWQMTAVALPALVIGVAPFVVAGQPVQLGKAVTAWCRLVTALLFWTAAGILSLGASMG
jgi:hypothetical protein